MNELKLQIENFENSPFPEGVRSVTAGGKNTTLLTSELLGVAHSVVTTNGKISSRMREQLSVNLNLLSEVINEVDQAAKDYFVQLQSLCEQAQDKITDLR